MLNPAPCMDRKDRKHSIGIATDKLTKEIPSSKLVVRVLVKKFIAFNETLKFIPELKKTHRLTLSWTSWIQFTLLFFNYLDGVRTYLGVTE